jgi:hypothetical protein
LGYYNYAKYQKEIMMSIKKDIGADVDIADGASDAVRRDGGRKKGLT